MPTKKSKRKPQATGRLVERRLDKLSGDLLLVAVGANGQGIQPLFQSRVPPDSVAQATIDRIFKRRTPKTVLITKICRAESGQEYIAEPIEIGLSSCFLTDHMPDSDKQIADWISEKLEQVTHNPKHLICDAYIVAHKETEISEAFATRIFNTQGAWKHQARWEKVK